MEVDARRRAMHAVQCHTEPERTAGRSGTLFCCARRGHNLDGCCQTGCIKRLYLVAFIV